MKLTRTEHRANDTVALYLDGEEDARLEIPLDLFVESRLALGDAIAPDRLERLRGRAEVARARESALHLLAHRARAREELRRRLRRKDFPDPVIEDVLAWLAERGYVDDDAFAEAFVRDRLRLRPRGAFALGQELRAKGVAPDVADAAVARVMDAADVDEAGLARNAADAWARKNRSALRQLDDSEVRLRTRRRLYGHLARRGFSSDAIRGAIDRVLERPEGSGDLNGD